MMRSLLSKLCLSENKNFIDSILQNLTWLLNSNKSAILLNPNLLELKKSVLTYGINSMDLINLSPQTLCEEITAAILHHEPRLQSVETHCINSPENSSTLELCITAKLHQHQTLLYVTFESKLDLIGQTMQVS